MRGFCDERQQMRNFRVDRIAEQPKLLNQDTALPYIIIDGKGLEKKIRIHPCPPTPETNY